MLLTLALLSFQSLEGDEIRVEAHDVPGGSASVVVLHTREGHGVSLADNGWAEVEIAGRRFQVDGEYLSQWKEGWVRLGLPIESVIQRLEMSDAYGDTMDGDNGPLFPPPGVPVTRTNRIIIKKCPLCSHGGSHFSYTPGADWDRLDIDEPPPAGPDDNGGCDDPPPGARGGEEEDSLDDDSGPFDVVLGPPPGG